MQQFLTKLTTLLKAIERYRFWLFWVVYGFGVFVYMVICSHGVVASLFEGVALFAFNVVVDSKESCSVWVYLAGFLAAFYTVYNIFLLLAKGFLDNLNFKNVIKDSYIVVCGLGQKGVAFVESELNSKPLHKIVAIEKDSQNPNIERLKDRGVAILVADASEQESLSKLNLKNIAYVVLFCGDDMKNFEIALLFKNLFAQNHHKHKKLYLHSSNMPLNKLYKEKSLLYQNEKLDLNIFSIAKNSAKQLFLNHSIDGDTREYIDSNKEFGIVVVGATTLGLEVMAQAALLAHLPNQNQVTIYCISQNSQKYKELVEYRYPQIDKIEHIKIEYIEHNFKSKEFFGDNLWHKNLTHIALCLDDAKENFEIAITLSDSTYITDIEQKSLKPKIHIAIYDNPTISKEIEQNSEVFANFYPFADISKMASKDVVLQEKFEQIAKNIHFGYGESYNDTKLYSNSKEIEKKWYENSELSNRASNIAQAYHLPLKLKALGFSYKDSNKKCEELLQHNLKLIKTGKLAQELKSLELDIKSLKKRTKDFNEDYNNVMKFDYFPTDYNLLINRLIRAEHNRWNAFHYIEGWVYSKTKNKPTKQHNCLKPLEEFEDELKYTALYDLYATIYIPNLLASVGLEIE